MDRIKTALHNYFTSKDFGKRFFIMMLGVVFMGFWLSFLIPVDLGTDPCTFMNVTISERLGILIGTWQVLFFSVLLILVLIWGREHIGLGTLANMFLIGYTIDFFRWLWGRTLPESLFTQWPTRIAIFVVSLIMFVVSASLYMNANMGVAPYDAIPMMVKKYLLKKVPFSIIRIVYDFTAIVIGILLGGKPNIGIVLMALLLGPVITAVGRFLNKNVFHIEG
ncbi:YczE/YyaS/YitT family protein [Butyrivibrio sp. FCS014]|uniref:YczE/YyaS/YitT family protein n=1 Tax=Butyrivibrio sp. FCS014 TaxID=1408304 RepID=UPI000466948F|nr:hypothetical protein [Butyrivibrio sp. FCS014]